MVFIFVMYFIQHCFISRPSDSFVSEDAGIEPRTVATVALAVRRSDLSAGSHPQLGYISSTARLYIIHSSAISHPQLGYISSTARLYLIHSRLDPIHNKVLFIYIGIFSVSLEPTGQRFSFSKSFPESQINFLLRTQLLPICTIFALLFIRKSATTCPMFVAEQKSAVLRTSDSRNKISFTTWLDPLKI